LGTSFERGTASTPCAHQTNLLSIVRRMPSQTGIYNRYSSKELIVEG
jgi:hypothetical protein